MSVHNHTEILFAGNYAQRVGGAIFVKSCSNFVGLRGKYLCFFQLPDVLHKLTYSTFKEALPILNISFTFVNNNAKDGGDAIYGGMLRQCVLTQHSPITYSLTGAFLLAQSKSNIITYTQPGFSKITSDPTRVCLCMDGKPDCFTIFASKTHYPGKPSLSLQW